MAAATAGSAERFPCSMPKKRRSKSALSSRGGQALHVNGGTIGSGEDAVASDEKSQRPGTVMSHPKPLAFKGRFLEYKVQLVKKFLNISEVLLKNRINSFRRNIPVDMH